MKVLVVGGGGREHAMCRALATTPGVEILAAPGNPGTAGLGRNLAVDTGDVEAVVRCARREGVDLVLPGPEAPLVAGMADALAATGIPCCGPGAAAARLEASKAFTREVAAAVGVPSPSYRIVDDAGEVEAAVASFSEPPVVKADGLAGGKGVSLPQTAAEASAGARALLDGRLGAAGMRVVLEERLSGSEASLFYVCRGTEVIPLPHARDHKRLGDGGTGPNTGGMGAVSPNPDIDSALEGRVRHEMVLPVLDHLAGKGMPYTGFLFVGLMLTGDGPRLLEFNVRLGDPEAQAILPRLPEGRFLEMCLWAAGEGERPVPAPDDARPVCAVVLAAAGYPVDRRRGDPITIDDRLAGPDRWFIHAGTRSDEAGLVTAGGRVGAVVAQGATAEVARRHAYEGVSLVRWDGMIHRTDIGLPTDG